MSQDISEDLQRYQRTLSRNYIQKWSDDRVILKRANSIVCMVEVVDIRGGLVFSGDFAPAVFKWHSGSFINKLRWVAGFARHPGYGSEKYQIGMSRSLDPLCRYDIDIARDEAIAQIKEDLQDLLDDCLFEDERNKLMRKYNQAIQEVKDVCPEGSWDTGRALMDIHGVYNDLTGDWESDFGKVIPYQVLIYAVAAGLIVEQYDAIYSEVA